MKLNDFKAVCKTLWGPQYRSPAAREVGVHIRTFMRYDAGEREVPARISDYLMVMLIARKHAINKLIIKLGGE